MSNYPDASLRDAEQYKIYDIQDNQFAKVPGYLVVSTAKLNVEDEDASARELSKISTGNFVDLKDEQPRTSSQWAIEKITKRLIESQDPEIVINIHGYSSTRSDGEEGSKKIYDYVNKNIKHPNKYIFIGYRWPSENPFKEDESGTFKEKIRNAFFALPILPATVLLSGLSISIISTFVLLFVHPLKSIYTDLLTVLLLIFGIASSAIFTLLLMRIVVYFRDSYRASNYGVLDLVELLRQLDYLLKNKKLAKRIKISFIGHSMGCFVVTNVLRILSDVFDVESINKNPSSNIGNVFCLGRLVLVAPDIPVETILPGRANFLRSSLRRCEEAYIFSNEGDLALRLTSTAANYFSFPAKTRISGYRLGNVTVSHFNDQKDKAGYAPRYGIVNLHQQDGAKDYKIDNPYKYLEIRSSNREHRKLEEMRKFSVNEVQAADLFTYFDCTDYKDDKSKRIGIVSSALQKPAINLWDYVSLTLAFLRKAINHTDPNGVDTHTGYFEGRFSQQAIYELAFLGFQGFLKSLSCEGQGKQIHAFSQECKNKQIQVVLASKLYHQN